MEREDLKKYETDYTELPFENILREYRQQNIFNILATCPHKKILEIGSGPLPLFRDFNDFEKMVVVEPGVSFYNKAKEFAGTDNRVELINDFFENVVQELLPETFDFIVIGGFLHEIDNPGEVLQAVIKVCGKNTIVHSFVPNANSFHRLVAFEMGIIKDVYQKSGHDELFNRVEVYNMDSFKKLFTQNGLSVTSSGTYFLKPFTNGQMDKIVTANIIDQAVLEGLNKMTKYFPDHGSEMYINSYVN